MRLYKDERTALFIDGSNLYATAKALGFDIDYKSLLNHFESNTRLMRAIYYTALMDDAEYSPIRPLIDWLDYNGFMVVTKPAKEFTDAQGRRKVKGNMDIELTVDAMELAPHVDHIVLFSGDGDFKPLVESLQRQGVRVSVVSTIRSIGAVSHLPGRDACADGRPATGLVPPDEAARVNALLDAMGLRLREGPAR